MKRIRQIRRILQAVCVPLCVCLAWGAGTGAVARGPASSGGSSAPTGNSDPVYQELRQLKLGNESLSVHEVTLKRDAGTFVFHSGTVCFAAPVNGRVTGAVFDGDGSFKLVPPTASERQSLSLLTKAPEMEERFDDLALRFTDETYAELKGSAGASAASGAACKGGVLSDSQHVTRYDINYNLEARILQDLLGRQPGGLFVAFIKGKKYSDKMIYYIDPHGVPFSLAPEEVAMFTYGERPLGDWAVFHFSPEYANGQAVGNQRNGVLRVKNEKIDTEIEGSGKLDGKTATTIACAVDGLRVIPFHLFPTLRVEQVTGEDGQPLEFIQEDKNQDAQYWVILPKALAAGQEYTITSTYSGKDALVNEGSGNYFPVARTSWYPAGDRWDDFPTFDMTFSVPKGMNLVATGKPLSNVTEGKFSVSHWKSEQAQPVAGFQMGKFKEKDGTIANLDNFKVEAFANDATPGMISGVMVEGQVLGRLETASMADKALAEAQLAVEIYSSYFGRLGYERLAMTQQTATNFGQSWPEMIYLPISYFFDETMRHYMHMEDPKGYFTVVAPHEVAHQWWGHTVTWGSYRDQWMSEGFSDFSASLYLQMVWKSEPQRYFKFWSDERELLQEKNKEGHRAIDVGPLTMGYRLSNSKAGFDITRRLIYPKGAYVLQMLRMMMWDRESTDKSFKEMMQDFVKTYAGRSATTEDFKAMVERHMTPQMNLDGNRKMDWFFNEYVYGTALPSYSFEAHFDKDAKGTIVAKMKLTQSGVDAAFKMPVPIYLELADGKTAFLGRARMIGNSTWQQDVPLAGLKDVPKRAMINYNYDVLCAK